MSRWICIDDICIPSDENDWEELVAFADAIAEQEPIEIIRCGECKHFHKEGITDKSYYCKQFHDRDGFWREVNPDGFCSYGEREGE